MELINTQSLTIEALLIYVYILDKGLDFMCLTETWHKTGDNSPPWFTHELWKIKTAGHVLERHCRHSGLTVHKLAETADAGSPSRLLLDLTSAFDTVDHTIPLGCLHTTIGLSVLPFWQS